MQCITILNYKLKSKSVLVNCQEKHKGSDITASCKRDGMATATCFFTTTAQQPPLLLLLLLIIMAMTLFDDFTSKIIIIFLALFLVLLFPLAFWSIRRHSKSQQWCHATITKTERHIITLCRYHIVA